MPDPSRDLLPVVLKRAGEDLQPLVDRVKQGTMYTQVRCRSTVSTVCLWYTLRATPSFRVMQVVAPLSSSVEAAASSGVEGIGNLYSHYSPRVSGGNPRKSRTTSARPQVNLVLSMSLGGGGGQPDWGGLG